jgi:plastocyanin
MQSRVRVRSGFVPLLLAFFAGLSVLVVGAVPSTASATTHTVTINSQTLSYSPATITINVGDTVKWVHDSLNVPHSVTALDGSFDSSPHCSYTDEAACLGPNATYSHTFTKAGTFKYDCRIHGSIMSGTVVVKGATTSKPKITAVNPTTIKHGAKNVKFVITGSGFVTGIKIKISGAGIAITSPHRVDADHLQMMLTVTSTAGKTARSVTVTNVDGGTFTKAAAVKVT